MSQSLLVVIPARNEAESLPHVVDDLRRHAPPCEILVVDDASNDATPAVMARLGVRRLRLGLHLGIGGALRTGLRYARTMGFARVVRFDGDGQHLAREIPRLLAPLDEKSAETVLGSRYRDTDGTSYRAGGLLRLAQRILAVYLSLMTGRRLTDPTSGLWAFGPRAVEVLSRHHPTGYPEPELLLFLHRNGIEITEVPVEMRPRRAGRTSLTSWRAAQALARVLLAVVIVPLRSRVVHD